MTEDQIERKAELKMDALDACLVSGSLTQAEYDEAVKRLHAWTEAQYDGLTKA